MRFTPRGPAVVLAPAIVVLSSWFAHAPGWELDPRAAFHHALILEAANAIKSDIRKLDRHRPEVARQITTITDRPRWMREIRRDLRENPDLPEALRRELRANVAYHELALASEKSAFYDEFPAIAQALVGFENPYGAPYVSLMTGAEAGDILQNIGARGLSLYMSSLPFECVRPDYAQVAMCREQVPAACAEYYHSDGRHARYWEISEDLELVERTATADQAEVDRVARLMIGLTPSSRQTARWSAKALVGVCGWAAGKGRGFPVNAVAVAYLRWPEWTQDLPDPREAEASAAESLCRQLSPQRRDNLQRLGMDGRVGPEGSMRVMELLASLESCPRERAIGAAGGGRHHSDSAAGRRDRDPASLREATPAPEFSSADDGASTGVEAR